MSTEVSVRVETIADTSMIEEDDGWGFSVDGVTVTFSNDAWWRFLEMVKDWLCECQHCGKPFAETKEGGAS